MPTCFDANLKSRLKGLGPIAAVMLAVALAGCHGTVTLDGDDGKKLSELDLSGDAPSKLVLAGPDRVKLHEGPKLAIAVEGDGSTDELRFTLKDGTLAIMRPTGLHGGAPAIINVTMPAPQELTIAGTGSIDAPTLARDASVTIAGTGGIRAPSIAAENLKLTVAGTGALDAGGTVKNLNLKIAGAGDARMAGLRADHVKITIAGSGSATITSDGDVVAKIVGSGDVTVRGRATCKVSSVGSGRLICESGQPKGADAATEARGVSESTNDTEG